MRICKYELCDNPIEKTSQRNNIYCSSKCSSEQKKYSKIISWLDGSWDGSIGNGELSNSIKRYLISKSGNKCSECGWNDINPSTGRTPLEIDHVNGVSTDNSPENLRVLCPNCHSLTPTYGRLNEKSTRTWRKKYYGQGGSESLSIIRSGDTLCECGNSKYRTSLNCVKCFKDARNRNVEASYPPIDIIIKGVRDLGMAPYAKTINKSDNAVRKHLKRNGLSKDDWSKVVD